MRGRKTILYVHGFASSGQSTKAQYFGEKCRALPHVKYHAIDFNPSPKDFEYVTTDGLGYLEPIPPATPMIIIHGKSDTTVPTDDSRAYAVEYPDQVQLIEVETDHDLNGHLDLAWRYVQSFLLGA